MSKVTIYHSCKATKHFMDFVGIADLMLKISVLDSLKTVVYCCFKVAFRARALVKEMLGIYMVQHK